MSARARRREAAPGPTAATAAVLLAVHLLKHRVAPRAALPASLTATALVLGIGRRASGSWAALGMSRDGAGRGLRDGARAAGGVAVLYALGAALPRTRPLFADGRAADTLGGVLRQTLVEVPLGTVLLEETAFRGVLPALLRERCSPLGADAIATGLFGLWHILPSGDLAAANPTLAAATAAGRGTGGTATALGSVAATTAGGAVFAVLRRRSGSLLAPALLHTAFNSLGYLAAAAARHRNSALVRRSAAQP